MYLNCHSYYSLRFGTIPVEELVAEAEKFRVEALALTDINCTTGVFDFVRACKNAKVKPVVGVEFRKDNRLLYIGLAKSLSGFRELNELLTKTNLGEMPMPLQSPSFREVFVIYPSHNVPQILQQHEYIGIRIKELRQFKNPLLGKKDKLVCLHTVNHRNEEEFELHQLLRCIDHNILLTHLEAQHTSEIQDVMLPVDRFEKYYSDYPEVLRNTRKMIDQCEFEFNDEEPKNKRTFTGSFYEDKVLLESLAMKVSKIDTSPMMK